MQGEWLDTVFEPAYTDFTDAFTAWLPEGTRTKALTATLDDKQKAFVEVYRKLYTAFLKDSPFVSNTDLVLMGLPERRSGGGTPAPVPTTVPEAEVRLPSPAVVEIHFRDSGADKKAKPAGVHGAEILWSLLDEPPASWTELKHSSFDTHTPFSLTFDGTERGKRLYFAMRWENTRGEKGPWSEIQIAVVP
jgi:hypothetical protein